MNKTTYHQADGSQIDLKEFECPVCIQLPKGKIFQCSEGHSICEVCISHVNVTACPQCRQPYGDSKIRNRKLEDLLDKLNLICPYKKAGCTVVVNRSNLEDHPAQCKFRPIALCAFFGYKSCKYLCPMLELIEHFQTTHSTHRRKSLTIRNFFQTHGTKVCHRISALHSGLSHGFEEWKVDHPHDFLMVLQTSFDEKKNGFLNVGIYFVGCPLQLQLYQVKIKISASYLGKRETGIVVWSGFPSHYLRLEKEDALEFPLTVPFQRIRELGQFTGAEDVHLTISSDICLL